MNFLALAQKLRQECEIAGTGPADTTTQTGELQRLVSWVNDAWEDIQNKKTNWRWMRRQFTLNTVLGDGTYASSDATDVDAATTIARFGHWWAHDIYDPYLSYLQSGGVSQQYRLIWLPWEQFRWLYRVGTQNNGQPIHVSVDHKNNLCLGPAPNGVYVITGDFQRSIQSLTADADIPEMPTQFHKLIVYWAMVKYGANSVAAEILTRSQLDGARLMSALEFDQLPQPCLGDPLA